MDDGLLILNAGSSSLKFALFSLTGDDLAPVRLLHGQLSGIGTGPVFRAWDPEGAPFSAPDTHEPAAVDDHSDAIALVLDWLHAQAADINLIGVGHRVVHGGDELRAPVLVDENILAHLDALAVLAPHHQPHNLAAIRAVARLNPTLSQVACFDTAFHASQPAVARRLPIPRQYQSQGLQRYGFHGLSYEYIVSALPGVCGGELPARVVVAHLGNGASLCAVGNGVSQSTTMGFSTLDGVMMGTRSGSIDPGVLLHLMREEGFGESELTDLVYNRCGLLGVSGISSDMRELLASDEMHAGEAVELYCHSLIKAIGSLAAVLEGVDALVFTGGIGEHAARVRERVCRRLQWLGLQFDAAANETNGPLISRHESQMQAWVIPTDEERIIAQHSARLLCA